MPKRKAASHKKQDSAAAAKKPRAAAAAAAVALENGDNSPEAAQARVRLAPRIAVQTLKLMDAIKKNSGGFSQRMQTVVNLLEADASRSESLIDLSLVVEGEKSCVLFQLLQFFWDFRKNDFGADDMKADMRAAQKLIVDKVLPRMQNLLRSFDSAAIDAATGNNALHEMCRLFTLRSVNRWTHKLTDLLIAHGVSLHTRNKKGRTPLLEFAHTASTAINSASGICLLLQRGADLNAQDNNGNGVLHLLVQRKAAALMDDLFDGDGTGPLDFALRNSAGQTAADIAAIQLAEQTGSADSAERRIHRLMVTQAAVWIKHARSAQPTSIISAPPQSEAAAANTTDSLQTALVCAKHTSRSVVQTLQLVDAVQSTDGSYTQRMRVVVDLLQAGADQHESPIDLSLIVEGESLLDFFNDCNIPEGNDAEDVKADKISAKQLICKVMPLMQTLLRSFDPATVNIATGNNALHEMCRLFILDSLQCWDYKLTKLLISHGVSVHARNKAGRTPLLEFAHTASDGMDSAHSIRLLVAHGADLDAQDKDGNGLPHLLVRSEALDVLKHLFAGDEATQLNHSLLNSKDQTAADLAAIQLAQLQGEWEESDVEDEEEAMWWEKELRRARRIQQLMAAQKAAWIQRVRPALLLCLERVLPVADVAKLALGYIDGSGRPSDTAAGTEPNANGEAEPAAATAAAALP